MINCKRLLCGLRRALLGSALVALISTASSALAAPITFANFTETAASRPFSFTNTGGIGGMLGYNTSVPIQFNFTAATGLPTNDRAATLTIVHTGTFVPASTSGSNLDQPITGTLPTYTITETATGKNLLTMIASGDIQGKSGATSGSLAGSQPADTIAFTSDYINFVPASNGYSFALTSITPTLSIGPGGFLNSFTSDVVGAFSTSDQFIIVPEPASAAMIALASLSLLVRTKRRN